MRRIKWLADKDPKARFLVFSSWTKVLDVLSFALRENDVAFAYAKTAKQLSSAVRGLREGSSRDAGGEGSNAALQAVLLPIKQGANGLNLTGTSDATAAQFLYSPTRAQKHS